MVPTPPSLWTDRPARSDHDWLAAEAEAAASRPEPTPAAPPGRPLSALQRAQSFVLLAIVMLALLGGALYAGTRLDDDGDDAARSAAAPLPAAAGTPAPTAVNAIYARASEGVVNVRAGSGSGTGFLLDREGTIVTNAHVVGTSDTVQIRLDGGEQPIDGRVAGRDVSSDLAVVRIDAGAAARLEPIPLADSDDVEVGDTAIAIGFPLGLDKTATSGIISGVGREIEAPNGFSIDEVLQTDAPINPGNSGGPLIDADGRVIGVNSQIATAGGGGGNVGIGFAVPSNTVRELVPQLKAGRTIRRPYMGISTGEAPNGGAVVGSVTAGGPAADAGIATGDVVVRVDGERVDEPSDVASAIADDAPGERVEVVVRRGGGEQTFTVTLADRPESAATGATP